MAIYIVSTIHYDLRESVTYWIYDIRIIRYVRYVQKPDWHEGNMGLYGDRLVQYAMDLIQPYRLIFTQYDNTVDIVEIQEIVDYH